MDANFAKAARLACLAFVAAAELALAGCKTMGLEDGPGAQAATGTNAPVAGFINMQGGTEEDFILNVGRRTFFAEGSAELDDTARTTLDKQAEWLRHHPHWLLKLQGFADDPGSAQQNTALSKKRAEAVMAYLASRGVERRRMWAKGYGKERIVRDCPDISCTSQNRRVISNLRNERET
jgi:peptidoglycan-associated lipoprotein